MSTASPSPAERMARLQQWFEELVDLDTGARDQRVEALRQTDPALADELRALLAAHESTGSRLASPYPLASALTAVAPATGREPGTRVGAYRITRQIGAGGMGVVYEAVRADDELQMRVAIKFLPQHGGSDAARQRFRAERQILASLRHRNIATLLDGGVTPDGQPYFVMEHIEGEPITRWCNDRRLGVRERLGLFRQVCAAVQYAHQHLVVHRDLKPGNILVTADGTVKLLDFGIAKLLRAAEDEPESGEALPTTRAGARAYTLEYAAPEQVLGLPIGTRADVYSLGVVLYELLTGARPLALSSLNPLEAGRVLAEAAPARPSAAVTAEHAGLLGERTPGRARARVAGDLDAILLQALRKEPDRRYGSASDLAEDLQRHLDGLPVRARPEGLGYRFGRLVRRHRATAIAAGLAVVSLVGGTVASTLQARAAEAERARATEVTAFLTTMLGAASPSAFGRDVQVREVLDSAAIRAADLADRPLLEAEIRTIIGGTYVALGEFELAEREYRRVVEAHAAATPDGSRAAGFALSRLSSALDFQGRWAEADSVLQLAGQMFARHDPAELGTADFYELRGRLLHRLGRSEEAAALLRTALALEQERNPVNDSTISTVYGNLGVIVAELGELEEAERLLRSGVEAGRRVTTYPLGTAAILSPLASVLELLGKAAAAESTYREAIGLRAGALGPEHPDYLWTVVNFADFLVEHQRPGEAAEWARQVLAHRGGSLPESHPNVGTALSVMSRAMLQQDSLARAITYMEEAVRLRREYLPPGYWATRTVEARLGSLLTRAGQFGEAERLLRDAEAALVETRGEASFEVRNVRTWLAELYEAWQRPGEAAAWREKLRASPAAGASGG